MRGVPLQRCGYDGLQCGLCLVGQCRIAAFQRAQERSLSPKLAQLQLERDMLQGRVDELEAERLELRERVACLRAQLAAEARPRPRRAL